MYYIILTLFIMYTIVYINDAIIARPSHCPVLTTYSMQMNRQWEGPQAGSSGSGAFCFQEGAWEWTQVWWWDVVKSTVLWTIPQIHKGGAWLITMPHPVLSVAEFMTFRQPGDHVEDSCRNERHADDGGRSCCTLPASFVFPFVPHICGKFPIGGIGPPPSSSATKTVPFPPAGGPPQTSAIGNRRYRHG